MHIIPGIATFRKKYLWWEPGNVEIGTLLLSTSMSICVQRSKDYLHVVCVCVAATMKSSGNWWLLE